MHTNSPICNGCDAVLHRYPGINPIISRWVKHARVVVPDLHICQAGRGRKDQEADFKAGKSKAHYGQSPHNFNMAVDCFRLLPNGTAAFPEDWFKTVLAKLVAQVPDLEWSGNWHDFHEYDHVELKHWRYLTSQYPDVYVPVDGPALSGNTTSQP